MPKRPFLVLPGGHCEPLEGEWRVAELCGDWYVLGHHSVVPCGSQRAAHGMLEQLHSQTDADRLAEDAIERLDALAPGLATEGSRPPEALDALPASDREGSLAQRPRPLANRVRRSPANSPRGVSGSRPLPRT